MDEHKGRNGVDVRPGTATASCRIELHLGVGATSAAPVALLAGLCSKLVGSSMSQAFGSGQYTG